MPMQEYYLPQLPKPPDPEKFLDSIESSNSDCYEKSGKKNVQEEEQVNDVPQRGYWGKSIESLLLCISMSVGLGNVWRFPNVAYNNGGGAFLIPYLLLLVIIGRPLYYLELILGQFSSQGSINVWRVVPFFKGIGFAQVFSVSFVLIFYNYLMALSVYYIYGSMHECLPWTACNFNNTTGIIGNISYAEHYWKYSVLELDPEAMQSMKSISWKLCICLFITWILVYISVIQGTNSLGKMAYFTAIFPYVVLTALLIVAMQEEGSIEGIKFFFKPDLQKLLDINVWYRACEQSFFSLAIGFGNIIMISSYNKFNHKINRDAIVITIVDTIANILSGCVIFSVLGTLAHRKQVNISEVVQNEGLGLAFIVYPEALAKIKFAPQLWSVLFFIMLFTLGIGSSMSQMETILTVLKDRFPGLRNKKPLLSLVLCILFFCLGLTLATNVGQHILVLLNNYGVSAALYLYATLQSVAIMWIYGVNNFCEDVKYMLGSSPGLFWKITWAFTAPIGLTVIFIYGHLDLKAKPDEEGLPSWAMYIGWGLAFLAVVQIPIWGIHVVFKATGENIFQKFRNSFKASHQWGPSDPIDRAGWLALKQGQNEPVRDVVYLSTVF